MTRTALSLLGLTSIAAVQSPATLDAYLAAHPAADSIAVAPDPGDLPAMDAYGELVKGLVGQSGYVVAVDLSRVPPADWTTLLGRWIVRPGATR